MTMKLGRRQFLATSAAAAAYLSASGLARAQSANLRMAWWGGQARADLTLKALAVYAEKNPSVTVDTEYLGWGDYWPRVSTQTAGGNTPDLIQMSDEYLAEYASRGVLLDLEPYIPSGLAVTDFDQSVLDAGRIDGKLYAISAGGNSTALLFNTTAYEEAGVAPPAHGTTWEEFAERAAEFTAKTPRKGMFGSTDDSGSEPVMQTWLRQLGHELFTEDGELGYGVDEITGWFQLWADMRASGAIPPADVAALDHGDVDTSLFAQQRSALVFANSNQYVAYKQLTPDAMGIAPYPKVGPDGKGGMFIKPSMFFSVSAQTKFPAESVALMNFLLTDFAATSILGGERGIPSSAAVREALAPTLDEATKLMADYISGLGDAAGPLPRSTPPGGGELTNTLLKASQEVAFGSKSPAYAAASYVATCQEILARNK